MEFSGFAGPSCFSLAAGKCSQGWHSIGLWVQNMLSFLSDRSNFYGSCSNISSGCSLFLCGCIWAWIEVGTGCETRAGYESG